LVAELVFSLWRFASHFAAFSRSSFMPPPWLPSCCHIADIAPLIRRRDATPPPLIPLMSAADAAAFATISPLLTPPAAIFAALMLLLRRH
jgi:hypothetical protein